MVFTDYIRKHPLRYIGKVASDLIPAVGAYFDAVYYSYVPFLLLGLFIGCASFALLVGAVWSYISQQHKMAAQTATMGTVIELVTRAENSSSIFCPVVEFTGPSGEKVRFTSDFGSRPASHRVGQSVKVRYDPSDPQQAEIESALSLWLVPLILVFIGLVACCLSVAFLGMYGLMNLTSP